MAKIEPSEEVLSIQEIMRLTGWGAWEISHYIGVRPETVTGWLRGSQGHKWENARPYIKKLLSYIALNQTAKHNFESRYPVLKLLEATGWTPSQLADYMTAERESVSMWLHEREPIGESAYRLIETVALRPHAKNWFETYGKDCIWRCRCGSDTRLKQDTVEPGGTLLCKSCQCEFVLARRNDGHYVWSPLYPGTIGKYGLDCGHE